jgi:ASC-1-like (ASCH) protein
MPYSPKYYLDLAEKYGLRKAKDLYAYFKDSSTGIPARVERLVERIKRKTGVEIRSLDMKNFRRDVEIIKGIYNKGWEKNWGNVPMTEKEMDDLAATLRNMVEPELVKFAFVKGQAVGVSIVLPNLNELLIKFNGSLNPFNLLRLVAGRRRIRGLRALLFGFLEGYRQTGLPLVLYYESEAAGRKLGYQWVELSWNLEDNELINKFDEMLGARIYKRYRIYETQV